MKIYTELFDGKWIVTGNESVNENGEFILVPHIKGMGSPSQPPTLICDCNDVTASWNGNGFLVTLPTTNTTHNFTLTWGVLTRTFQFIVSNRDFSGEIVQLQSEKSAFDNYAQGQNSQFKNFISSMEIGVNNHIDSINSQVNQEIENSFSTIRSSNEALKNSVIFFENIANTNVQNLTSLRDEAMSRNDSIAANAYSMQITGYSDAAYRFSYIRTQFIERLLEDQFEYAKSSVVNSTSFAISSVKNKISEFAEQERNVLNRSDSELANLRLQHTNITPVDNNTQVNQPTPDANDFELEMLAMEFMGYPWRIFDMVRNEPGSPLEGSGFWTSRTLMGHNRDIAFTEVFDENQIIVGVQPPLPFEVLFTSKMFSVGNKYMIARSVKNNGMPQDLADRILPPNSTVFSFYIESGDEAGNTLKYYDRIFLNDEIKGVIAGLQVGECLPYEYRQMPSTWDNLPGVSDPGNVKINIRRDGENAYRVYYCDDNVDVNLGDLCIFPQILII